MSFQTPVRALMTAALLLPAPSWAGAPAAVSILFAPPVQEDLQEHYGASEAETLRSDILAALSRALRHVNVPAGTELAVTVRELAPTRPTRKQQNEDPALDPLRTRYIGGAELAGSVQDAAGEQRASVQYRYFAPTLGAGSVARDTWADARRAIEAFAQQLAQACGNLPPPAR